MPCPARWSWRPGRTAARQSTWTSTEYGWLWYFASVPVYLFIHDTYFYWTHRMMHHPKIFPVMHKVHHESRQPTPWAGFSFHPTESMLGAAILPVMALLIPIHVSAILFILVLMTIVSVTNHSGFELLPDRLVRGFVGPQLDLGGPPQPAPPALYHQLRPVLSILGQADGHRSHGNGIRFPEWP